MLRKAETKPRKLQRVRLQPQRTTKPLSARAARPFYRKLAGGR